jgi:exodeoxyribonuclease VII large subunit
MNGAPGHGEVWSVSRLVQELKSLLVSGLPPLWIEGEISNYTKSAAGHRYFSLKDDTNQLKCALFRGRSRALGFEPADGLKVVALGRVDLFGPRSEVQLLVEQLLPAGQGQLELALKELHKRLAAEGLFDPERKRPLPIFPRRVGVITSARGAAIRDILRVFARRAPHVQVVIADTPVQGAAAASGIAAAVTAFNRAKSVDVLIVARGGGSLEDLWAFNEEILVRAVAASELPVISGVGHEIDTTLTDLAADLRAATPTAAAEQAVHPTASWRDQLNSEFDRMQECLSQLCLTHKTRLAALSARYGFRRPEEALRTFVQMVDGLVARLGKAVPARLREAQAACRALVTRPVLESPRQAIVGAQRRVAQVDATLKAAWAPLLSSRRERLAQSSGGLSALSPRGVLDRGYAVLLARDGRVLSSVAETLKEREISAVLKDGKLTTQILSREHDATWP